jgi:hypothetical protein
VRLNPPFLFGTKFMIIAVFFSAIHSSKTCSVSGSCARSPSRLSAPNGLMFYQAVVTAELPFLKAMGRCNANWNAVEKDTGRFALTLITASAHAGHAIYCTP